MRMHVVPSVPKRAALTLAVGLAAASGLPANAELVYGVSDQLGDLISFDSASPGTLLSAHAITGLAQGEQLRGIDWFNGTLYGLGGQSHLYTLNAATGVATLVGSGSFSPVLNGVGFGFNAGTSQLYVASDLGQNLTLNPATGAATAGPNYAGATIDAMAYNDVNTLFYGVSAATHDLYLMNPVTGGTSLIGPTGVNFLYGIGFDISPMTDLAYFSGTVGGQTEFFNVNLTTGSMSLIGDVGTPGELTSGLDSITVVPEPATAALATIGGGTLLLWLRRKK